LILRLRKGLASRCWENLVLAMLGEQFMVGEEICGAVVSIRYQVSIGSFPFCVLYLSDNNMSMFCDLSSEESEDTF